MVSYVNGKCSKGIVQIYMGGLYLIGGVFNVIIASVFPCERVIRSRGGVVYLAGRRGFGAKGRVVHCP